ncbi:efflux RND transporter periplasmic adaptor subunit [Leptolyngbya sp. Heron Island J]|uniref:efflux RND transporter periplasmic adaptor subunit n=1 Tax=Leptolyngbya sp. Heron Island J TaxID=1385935 RepID=UPI0007C4D373|nr:efflux RND transporter periplasmic adaptor subunit [Leptolyngbya sp. Heron Island J]
MTSHASSTAATEALQSSSVASSQSSGKWLIWLMGLILLSGAGFVLWRLSSREPAAMQMPGAVPVTVEQLEMAMLQEQAGFVGTLDAQTRVVLRPEVAGRITRVYVAAGDRISAGDPIMELTADRSQAEVSAALAGISAARSSRDTAQARLDSLVAEQPRLEAELDLQTLQLERTQRLVTAGALAQQQLDEVERDRNVAIASLEAAQKQIVAARANVAETEFLLDQAQAQANAIREDLLDRTITAPISGIVGDIPVKLGDYVEINSSLTSITQNETLDLEIAIPTEQASEIQLGMPVEIPNFGVGGSPVTATIDFVAPRSDVDTQTVLAKAEVVNSSGRLQDDQRVDVRVILAQRSGLLVPATAITRLGGQTFVYVVAEAPSETEQAAATPPAEPAGEAAPQQMAQLRPVTLGAMQDNSFQVVEGLDNGEVIVTTGLLNLQDGTPIVVLAE